MVREYVIDIPSDVHGLLQLGDNFSLLTFDKNKILTEFIKIVGNNISRFQITSE